MFHRDKPSKRLSSNMTKGLHKVNDVITLRPLSVIQKNTVKTENVKNTINFVINGHIMVNFCTGVAHDNSMDHSK